MQYACVNDPPSLRYYLPLIFDGVEDISWKEVKPAQVGEDGEASDPRLQQVQVPTGVQDRKGKTLEFVEESRPHPGDSKIDKFLSSIESSAARAVQDNTKEAIEFFLSCSDHGLTMLIDLQAMEKALGKFELQVLFLILRMLWTLGIGNVFDRARTNSLPLLRLMQTAQRGLGTTLESTALGLKSSNTLEMNEKISAMLSLLMNLRDSLDSIISSNVEGATDFEWLQHARVYCDIYSSHVWLSLLNASIECQYEWQGTLPRRIVLSPNSERCLMTMAASLHSFRCPSLLGPAGTGKKSTIHELGRMTGHFVCHRMCTQGYSLQSIERLINGSETADCWLLLEGFISFSRSFLSVISSKLNSILLRSASLQQDVSVSYASHANYNNVTSSAIFLCNNEEVSSSSFFHLPENLRRLLRPVRVRAADRLHVAQVKLGANGIPEFATMARKLDAVLSSCRLHPTLAQGKMSWGMSLLLRVINSIILLKQEQGKSDPDSLVLLAFAQELGPRLIPEELRTFQQILAETFSMGAVKQQEFRASSKDRYLDLLRTLVVHFRSLGFVLNDEMQSTALRLYENFSLHSSLVVLGSHLSGKSMLVRLLADLTNASTKSEEESARGSINLTSSAGNVYSMSGEGKGENLEMLVVLPFWLSPPS
eukprot:768033-Hanusia_phi.AAC.8